MRFMMLIKADHDFEAGIPPCPELIVAMGTFAEEMTERGILLSSEGMKPSSTGTRVRYANGKRSVIDGPFAETKELIGGFAIIDVGSKTEAVELAKRVVAHPRRVRRARVRDRSAAAVRARRMRAAGGGGLNDPPTPLARPSSANGRGPGAPIRRFTAL